MMGFSFIMIDELIFVKKVKYLSQNHMNPTFYSGSSLHPVTSWCLL